MGKNLSKQGRFRTQLGRVGPEGECFVNESPSPSEDEFNIIKDDLNSILDGYPLTVVLPDEEESILGNKMLPNEGLFTTEINSDQTTAEVDAKSETRQEPIPQEFNYTLYGIDGQNKLKKSDIMKLVKQIQHRVSEEQPVANKSVKVNLTFSPSPQKLEKRTVRENSTKKNKVCDNGKDRVKSSFVKEAHSSPRSNVQDPVYERLVDYKHNRVSKSLNCSPAVPSKLCDCHKNANNSSAKSSPHSKRHNLDHFAHQDLYDMIQENMVKNNIGHYFKKSNETKLQNNHSKPSRTKYKHRNNFPECQDRRNHYLDLAGVEHCTRQMDHTTLEDDEDIYARIAQRQLPQRSRSHNNYDLQCNLKKNNYSKNTKLLYVNGSDLTNKKHQRSFSQDQGNYAIYDVPKNVTNMFHDSSPRKNTHVKFEDDYKKPSRREKTVVKRSKSSSHHHVHEHVHHHYHHHHL